MKRAFDLFCSIVALIVLSPVMLLVSILVLCFLGRPVLFSQVRPGKGCRPFRLLKFRTMTNERDETGTLLPNELRHTRFGRFLRSTSMDELPSLINVVRGDMSFVGPRPLKMDYIPLYRADQKRRHEVRPGITGWAQINGRNTISFTERFKLDVWYVDNQSLLLDFKILWLTVVKVFKRENIAPEGNVEMAPFNGTN